MTETQVRPQLVTVEPPGGGARSPISLPWLSAARLALRTAALGLLAVEVPVLVLWVTEPHSGAGATDSLRVGVALWLAAHHTGLRIGAAQVGVVPYGLTLVAWLLLWRGGRRAGVGLDRAGVLRWVGTVAPLYGVLTALLCLTLRGSPVRPHTVQALVGAAVLAALAAGGGAWRVADWRPQLPVALRDVTAGALLAMLSVLTAATLLAAVAVGLGHARVSETLHAVAPTGAGTAGLVVADLLATPLASLYAGSVLLGAGFGLGTGTHVGLTAVTLGPTPALPLLGAVPSSGRLPSWALLLLLVPVAAGLLGGLRAARSTNQWGSRLLRCGALGFLAGGVAAAGAWLADGPAGPGRLAVTGPSPWRAGLAAMLGVGSGAVLLALILIAGSALRGWWRDGPPA